MDYFSRSVCFLSLFIISLACGLSSNTEFRSTWVITWDHINRYENSGQNLYRLRSIMDDHVDANMNAVIFQPQSGSANIHILGSLEAEGLFFDFAWVCSMTSSFLPGKIKMPLFIPPKRLWNIVCLEQALSSSPKKVK